jgi:putative DNA primase/helicase
MHFDGANPDVRILQEALAYRRRGFSVIPLLPRRKEPALAKGTIVRYREEAASERTLRHWFAEEERNVGIITGCVSCLVVLDVDGDAGRQSLRGLQMPPTPVVLTGRGHHVYFRHPGGQVDSAIKGMPGVDILAEKRYVVAPSSIHPDGLIYEWHEFLPLTHTDLALPPPWLIELLHTLSKIQPASTHAAPRATHRSVMRKRLLPSLPILPPHDLPGGASKAHMFLLAPPGVDGEESE